MEGPGKDSEEYQKAVAICELDPADLKQLGIKDNDVVKVTNPRTGTSVHFWARESTGKHEGALFMPMGLWVNMLVEADTNGTGMPNFNTVRLEVEADPKGEVLTIKELLAVQRKIS